jgi:CRISPR-associated exonuclease Cas4
VTSVSGASEDDDFVPISALQHFAFCERQCALIHLERIWAENELTAEGRVVHERTDLPGVSGEGRIVRAVQLRSDRLRVTGRADVVEFLPSNGPGGSETPFPVEYKRGRMAERIPDRIQLCAQAMALEEMTGVAVPRGALFYHASRRRVVVECDAELRRTTCDTAARVHAMLSSGTLPKAALQPKCQRCSLREECQPAPAGAVDALAYVRALLREGQPKGPA